MDDFGPHASAGTVAEAGAADFVVLTVNWDPGPRGGAQVPPDREGRILIDATNQWAVPAPRLRRRPTRRSEAANWSPR